MGGHAITLDNHHFVYVYVLDICDPLEFPDVIYKLGKTIKEATSKHT